MTRFHPWFASLAFMGALAAPAAAKSPQDRNPSAVIVAPDPGGQTQVQVPPGSNLPPTRIQAPTDPALTGNSGNRAEAAADAIPDADLVGLVSQAEQAARRGDLRMSQVLAERVESRLLTRSTLAGTESMPATGLVVGRLQEGRVALERRDGSQAAVLFAEAAGLLRALSR